MKASASHTETTPCRRVGWSCAAGTPSTDAPFSPAWTLALAMLLGFVAGFILVLAVKAVTGTSARPVIRYSLPLELFQDSPDVQCDGGKRALNGQCVCRVSCDSLHEAEI